MVLFFREFHYAGKKQVPREMILTSALKLLSEQGYEAVNIKQLAADLGCSTQPIYLSFSGMDELRAELLQLAVKTFEDAMKRESADGVIRLYDMSYSHFAKKEPHLFCFLFMRKGAFTETKKSLLPMIETTVEELMTLCHIGHEEADLLHDQLWMHAHGTLHTPKIHIQLLKNGFFCDTMNTSHRKEPTACHR